MKSNSGDVSRLEVGEMAVDWRCVARADFDLVASPVGTIAEDLGVAVDSEVSLHVP